MIGRACSAIAQDSVNIGLIVPMTGQQITTGKEIEAAVRLYVQQHGTTVAGKKIEVVLKDDGAVPDNTKRINQELIVNDRVRLLAGFGVTSSAFTVAPLATQAKIPAIVMAAGTSVITQRSLYIIRISFTLAQTTAIIADWAAKDGIAPGLEAETLFKERFGQAGGQAFDADPGSNAVPLHNQGFDSVTPRDIK